MKINSVTKVVETNYYVEIEDNDPITNYVTFRRSEFGSWEIHMGESWESYYNSEKLEKEFQLWRINGKS